MGEGDEFVRVCTAADVDRCRRRVPPGAAAQGPPMPARPAAAGGGPAPMAPSTSIFLGGVPSGRHDAGPIHADGGRRHRARARAQPRRADRRAEASAARSGARWRALSELLPNVNGRVSETRAEDQPRGVRLPAAGGRFATSRASSVRSTCSTRASTCRSRCSTSTRSTTRAPRRTTSRPRSSPIKSARDLVVLVAGNAVPAGARRRRARADAARAQPQTAEALYQQARDLKQSGIVAGIDVLRARGAAQHRAQRATAAANDFEKAKLQLARVIGLPLGQAFTLDRRAARTCRCPT